MKDEEIVLKQDSLWEEILAALAAVRADEHAKCVRLLREHGEDDLIGYLKLLEAHKP